MKLTEANKDKDVTVAHLKKRVPVIATDNHPAVKRLGVKAKKRQVPEHMIKHLVEKGMIEDPKKPKKTEDKK